MQPGDSRTPLLGRKGCVGPIRTSSRWGGRRGRGSSQATWLREPPLFFAMTAFCECVFLGSPPGLEGGIKGNSRLLGGLTPARGTQRGDVYPLYPRRTANVHQEAQGTRGKSDNCGLSVKAGRGGGRPWEARFCCPKEGQRQPCPAWSGGAVLWAPAGIGSVPRPTQASCWRGTVSDRVATTAALPYWQVSMGTAYKARPSISVFKPLGAMVAGRVSAVTTVSPPCPWHWPTENQESRVGGGHPTLHP